MLSIRALAAAEPERADFHGVQAAERNFGYGHLLFPSAVHALPRGKGKLDEEETLRLMPGSPAALPVAEARLSHADLALQAVDALRRQVAAEDLAAVTHIVVANASLNQRINESLSGRVQHALGLDDALPFAVGQSGTAGVYNALTLIEALCAQGGRVLLVAADKWLYPFFRAWGDLVAYGDGAAAMLLDRRGEGGIGRILSHAVLYGEAIANPWAHTPAALADRLLPQAAQAAAAALDKARIRPSDVDWLLPAGFGADFAGRVADELGIAPARRMARAGGHLSNADPLQALLELRAALRPGEQATALLWDSALCGLSGAMVAQISAAA
ncbi:hypothetical protein [Chromobacterium alticapitis]|uniref:Beta-ketoacyl-[acyl-carrier-protein] synthase III N-terminal domain-containing protein n=1 Tax=Chromobacterium alticapitis TaxID=2073169 RepID=A0A2S5DI96_9NEIS|nr:hypothetical protein [Chromobacterium alticapitis]POZ62800.1 hypothetical protein C2I19_06505 [Chromobacterium alticapitis]